MRNALLILFLSALVSGAQIFTNYGEIVEVTSTGIRTASPYPITNAVQITAGTPSSRWMGALFQHGEWLSFGDTATSVRYTMPDPVPTNVVYLAHGWLHGYGITDDGNVFDYGGSLTTDSSVANFQPSEYHWVSNPITPGLWTNAIKTSCGDGHSALLTADGRVNVRGTRSSVYAANTITNGVDLHSCWHGLGVLKSDGTVTYAGASVEHGYQTVPANATNGWRLSGGMEFFALITSNKTVVAWGRNDTGQCDVPEDLTNVVQVAGGRYNAFALLEDGSIRTWGGNASWHTNLPSSVTNVAIIAGGQANMVFLKNVSGGEGGGAPELPPQSKLAASRFRVTNLRIGGIQ